MHSQVTQEVRRRRASTGRPSAEVGPPQRELAGEPSRHRRAGEGPWRTARRSRCLLGSGEDRLWKCDCRTIGSPGATASTTSRATERLVVSRGPDGAVLRAPSRLAQLDGCARRRSAPEHRASRSICADQPPRTARALGCAPHRDESESEHRRAGANLRHEAGPSTEEKMLQDRTAASSPNCRCADRGSPTAAASRPSFSARHARRGRPARGAHALLLTISTASRTSTTPSATRAGDACLAEIRPTGLGAACRRRPSLVLARRAHRLRRFAILSDAAAPAELRGAPPAIVAAAREPIRRGGQSYKIGASFGIAVAGGPGVQRIQRSPGRCRLVALRRQGRGRIRVAHFHPGMRADGSARVKTIGEVAFGEMTRGGSAPSTSRSFDLVEGGVLGHEALLRSVGRTDARDAAGSRPRVRDPSRRARLDGWVLDTALDPGGAWRRRAFAAGRASPSR